MPTAAMKTAPRTTSPRPPETTKSLTNPKIPKTLGKCVDLLYTLRLQRLAQQKIVDDLAKDEGVLREHLINNLPKSDSTGIAGQLARATIKMKTIAQAKDWGAIYAYIKKYDAFDLMQRRLADAAVEARWEDGVEIPGVEKFNVPTVSVNKV